MSSLDGFGGMDVFSSGQVASLCEVTRATVLRWISDGKLHSYALPSGHYRVKRPDLVRFLQQYRMPVPRVLLRRQRILVVDDDPEIVELVREALVLDAGLAVEVSTAHSGLEACLKAGEVQPDLMILDLRMGEVNGQDVAKTLASHDSLRSIRILVITGFATAQVLRELKNLGIRDILHKPFDIRDLATRVKTLLATA